MLGSGCNIGKDLSNYERDDQLVKYKDTGLYLHLYISIDHVEIEWHPWGDNEKEIKNNEKVSTTIWDTDWYNVRKAQSVLNMSQDMKQTLTHIQVWGKHL